jgi:excisionase family DNA binding protein
MTNASPAAEWMPVKEAAARLACDKGTLMRRLTRGDLNVRIIRMNRVIRINRADFEQALYDLAASSNTA